MRTRAFWVLFILVALTGTGWTFHGQENSQCNGCHVSFGDADNSQDESSRPAKPHMLKEGTPTEVCLRCHARRNGAVFSYDVTNPAPEKGGGNFIFLLEDNLNDSEAGGDPSNWIPGDAAGHNLNAPRYGLRPDMTLSSSPGGDFPAKQMECTSCHDPHGNRNFRMLYGTGPVQSGSFVFTEPAPKAEGISLRFGVESNSNHTAYRSGMSEWCANCHTDFHNTSYPAVMKHPSGSELGAALSSFYNMYNGTSDPTGGFAGTAYLALVPFEDSSPLNSPTSTQGPTASAKVMCLSCHRAHASSSPDAGRWDFNVTFLDHDGQESGSYAPPNQFGAGQRSLCNKCHVKDKGVIVRSKDLAVTIE